MLAAVVAVLLTVQFPTVTPTFALRETIIVLAGVVVGGMTRLLPATLGGFAIGYVVRPPRRRAADRPEPVPAVVRLRPRDPRPARAAGRPVHSRRARRWSACERAPRARASSPGRSRSSSAPALLGTLVSRSTEIYFINALVSVSIVVALYVFVGNSGVLSFGHISFVAVGAWAAGVLSVPEQEKPAFMPYLFDFLSDTRSATSRRS